MTMMMMSRYAVENEESRRQEWCKESRTEGEVKKTKQGLGDGVQKYVPPRLDSAARLG